MTPAPQPATAIQRQAIKRMIELENLYGRVFLEKSLHQARFDYQALGRVARGLDKEFPKVSTLPPPPEAT